MADELIGIALAAMALFCLGMAWRAWDGAKPKVDFKLKDDRR